MKLKEHIKNFNKKITKSNLVTGLISCLIYWYTRLVYKTTSWQIEGRENAVGLWEKGESFVLIGWHGRALMLPSFRDYRYPLDALVSLHNDGRMIAGVLRRYGLGTIGGSSNNNARGAALNLMSSLEQNRSICIIPDGPRGPRMHLSMSPVYYAQKTGKPVIGMTYSVQRCKIVGKAWDKMMVPFPFGKGICRFTAPIYIPRTENDEELEKYRLQVEAALNEINFESDRAMGLSPVQPGLKPKKQKIKRK